MAYLPGVEGGQAVADVLFGDVNPSGRLPLTYPKFPGGFTTYDHKTSEEKATNGLNVQWPFGYGLSYTTFAYKGLRLDRSEMTPDDTLTVTLEVTNTGDRAGKDTVQLYLSDLVASVTPPVKALKRFQKIELEPGQTETVRFELTWNDLSLHRPTDRKITRPAGNPKHEARNPKQQQKTEAQILDAPTRAIQSHSAQSFNAGERRRFTRRSFFSGVIFVDLISNPV